MRLFCPRTSARLTKSICTTSETNCQMMLWAIWPRWEHYVKQKFVARKPIVVNSAIQATSTSALNKLQRSSCVSKRWTCSESHAVFTMLSTRSNFISSTALKRRSSVMTRLRISQDTSPFTAAWMCPKEKLSQACVFTTRLESPISRMWHSRRRKAPRSNSRVARRMRKVAGSARRSRKERESWASMAIARANKESYLAWASSFGSQTIRLAEETVIDSIVVDKSEKRL